MPRRPPVGPTPRPCDAELVTGYGLHPAEITRIPEGTATDNYAMSADNAKATGWLMGGMTAVGVHACFVAAGKGMRLGLDRRRYVQWDAEWDLVEPSWSARFHR
ncbi:hypothetical protein [Streptomyces sp. NPDC050121]|uniref:hypothetical protein n=1 Tax=Streptomyces sp. NPDC050121 TaxID=3365601 RepID=UPI003797A3E5